ncbi:methyltransferase domain-containing protein [Streptomyces sp. NPDC003952]
MTKRTEAVGPSGLAAALVESGAMQPEWRTTFDAVPRDMFVPARIWPGVASGIVHKGLVDRDKDPDAWLRAVYSDIPLTTQWDDGEHTVDEPGKTPSSSNSLPSMVFGMLGDFSRDEIPDADPKTSGRRLEIGAGTGWNAALMAFRYGSENVVTIEYDPDVAEGARRNLRDAGLSPLVVVGDGRLGYPDRAPYSGVIVTCSIGELPYTWVEQTVPGGVIVAPWGTGYGGEGIVRLVVGEDGTASGPFTRQSAFMRIRQQRPDRAGPDVYFKGVPWPGDGVKSHTSLSPENVDGWVEQFAISLRVPGIFWVVERDEEDEEGVYVVWYYSDDTKSWASIDHAPGASEYLVVQSGPRRLWDEVEAAYRWWEGQGRPDFNRFGLTVNRNGDHAWLDAPDNPIQL